MFALDAVVKSAVIFFPSPASHILILEVMYFF